MICDPSREPCGTPHFSLGDAKTANTCAHGDPETDVCPGQLSQTLEGVVVSEVGSPPRVSRVRLWSVDGWGVLLPSRLMRLSNAEVGDYGCWIFD